MKYIVCFSGGHSSALVAIEAARKYGKENVILVNHDICPRAEDEDIKRFKKEIADYLGIEITYVNMDGWEDKDPLDICKSL
jgi:PP-loop superfamily ATP-utilizing enzyme